MGRFQAHLCRTAVALLPLIFLCASGCKIFTTSDWIKVPTDAEAEIHSKAKKDPFPDANEPPVESIKR